jgi:hypothetical protein
MRHLLLLLVIGCFAAAEAKTERSPVVTRQFQKENPCPSTGKRWGACPGWQKDHILALCNGGADATWNLQWLTIEQHKKKTKGECRRK